MLRAPRGPEEGKPVSDVRDPGRVTGPLPPPFRQKLGDTGRDFLFQEGFGCACNDEVIGKPDHVDFCPRVALEGWKGSFDVSFQTREGQVHEDR